MKKYLYIGLILIGLVGCANHNNIIKLTEDIPGLIKTQNKFGWMSIENEEFHEKFLDFVAITKGHVLDVGGTYGNYAIKALQKGAKSVVLNDIDKKHLIYALEHTDASLKSRLLINQANITKEINFPENSLDVILASRVLHFFTGEEIRISLAKFHQWLKPGGKVFILGNTIYRGYLKNYLNEYSEKQKTIEFPGYYMGVQIMESNAIKNLPFYFHYLDHVMLERELKRAGFKIDEIKYFSAKFMSPNVKLDGREYIYAIGKK